MRKARRENRRAVGFWSYSFDASGPGPGDQYYIDVLGVEPNWDGPYQMEVNGNAARLSGFYFSLRIRRPIPSLRR